LPVVPVVGKLLVLGVEQQHAVQEHEREEADRDEEGHRRLRVVLPGQLERLREKVEEGDAEHGPGAEAEDQVELVLVAQGERAAEERRAQCCEPQDESHFSSTGETAGFPHDPPSHWNRALPAGGSAGSCPGFADQRHDESTEPSSDRRPRNGQP